MNLFTRHLVTLLLPGVLLLSGCGAAQGIKASQETAGKFLTEMKLQQTDDAYRLCSARCQKVTSKEQLENLWQTLAKLHGPVKNWSFQDTRYYFGTNGSSVTLTYRLHCEQGDSQVKLLLVAEGNRWLIQGFTFSG